VTGDAGQHVGRVKRIDGGPQDGTWTWSCTGCQRGHEAEGARPLNGDISNRNKEIEASATAYARAKAWSAPSVLRLA
jgi:Zn-finger protein